MFIKFDRKFNSTTIECQSYTISYEPSETMNMCRKFDIDMNNDSYGNVHVCCDKDDKSLIAIYVENNDGKTIEVIYRQP